MTKTLVVPRIRVLLSVLLAFTALTPNAAAGMDPPRHPGDPLVPLVRRMDRYFQQHEVNDVALDSRYWYNPSEAIRMSVVSQLLAYTELFRVHPSRRIFQDIVQRADYLGARLDSVRSGTPFDGMLGLSLLQAWETTGDSLALAQGQVIVDELKGIPTSQCVLNGGLMVAMAMAEYQHLTGDVEAGTKAHDILAQLPSYQHPDGSFPHWCECSRDIHYTGWMAQELILIQRILPDPLIEPMLEGMRDFFEARIDSVGHTHYEEPCPDTPGCFRYYDSRRSGCAIDYDTRAWTVEPGYSALLFDRFHSPKYGPVMRFLLSLENRGTFHDVWDFIPPPDDPEYIWEIADTSVANMSIMFWSLASAISGRSQRVILYDDYSPGDDDLRADPTTWLAAVRGRHAAAFAATAQRWPAVDGLMIAGARAADYCDRPPGASEPLPAASGSRLGPIAPNPARDACGIAFTLAARSEVSLAIFDAGGRRVRELVSGTLEAGSHLVRWDRRDAAGNECRSGLYFVRLRVGSTQLAGRVLVMR